VDRSEARPRLEVADIFRAHGDVFLREHASSAEQRKVLRHIVQCRSAALGGHVDACDACGRIRISYNSCRDRHCPKCQCLKKAEWLAARCRDLLPVPYWHVVFTLPNRLHALALRNKRRVFDLLFETAAATLLTIAEDPKHLGAQIGFTAILHTWGQNLLFHPHVHCVVTGGGLDTARNRWVAARPRFFAPVKVLGRLFRGKFMAALRQDYDRDRLTLDGSAAGLSDPSAWRALLDHLYRTDWVVYAKPPFGGPKHVFRYLGRYTHRVAIANQRLVALEDGRVQFKIKDYAHGGRRTVLDLDALEFIRRFLLHVLPCRFTRIRHYGLLAPANVHTRLERARELLAAAVEEPVHDTPPTASHREPWWQRLFRLTGIDAMRCPHCLQGRLIRTSLVVAEGRPPP